jgi:ribonuclease BN (tRNA processing enzyme)
MMNWFQTRIIPIFLLFCASTFSSVSSAEEPSGETSKQIWANFILSRPKSEKLYFEYDIEGARQVSGIFDAGTGSAERIAALQIPYNFLDKVFLSHLHTDHFGDLDALFVGGALSGRQKPLRVWGPKGDTPERGTKYALDHLYKALTWDLDGRKGITDPRGYVPFEVTEFDYKGVNEIIYQENGVTIRTIPAIHALDGPVSFILEWNGLKFVFGGDTYPNHLRWPTESFHGLHGVEYHQGRYSRADGNC